MADLIASIAAALAAITLGWTAHYSFLVAPQAFRDLDPGRARRFARNAMKTGHPIAAGLAAAAALVALLGAAYGAAAVLALTAALFWLALVALAPRTDMRPPGGHRKLDTARLVASALTGMLMLALAAGMAMAALGI